MDIFKMMKDALAIHGVDDETVRKSWVQVAKLTPEDEGRRRAMTAAMAERKREHEMYAKKMAAIKATNDAEAAEWWNHVHKTYGLPEGNYHITDDAIVYVQPKEKP